MSELGDGQPLYLRDLTTGQELVFESAALPNRGVETASKLRMKRTLYPGGSEASTQVLGIEDEPIQLEGRWIDEQMGAADAAAAMVADVRAMYVGQHECEMTWGSLITVRGHISRWAPRWDGQSRVSWRLEFTPSETTEPEALFPVTYPETPETAVAWWEIVDAVSDALWIAAAAACTVAVLV
jgi:hypothetical protein